MTIARRFGYCPVVLTVLALASCGNFETDCKSPLGAADRNCDGHDDDDWDGDGSPADEDCDDSRADLGTADPDVDGFSTCTGDCDETSPDAAIRGPRGVVTEACDNVDNDCNDVIDVDDAGRSACAWTIRFERPPRVELDLLFVVDSSGSMVEEDGRLPIAGASFLPYVAGTDTHLGVVSNNTGAFQGHLHGASGGSRYLDLAEHDEDTAQAWWVEAADFEPIGSFANAGLDAAFLALDPDLAGGTFNLGFRRDDAPLAVVFVSDSDDASVVREVETFVPWLDSLEALAGESTAYGILSTDITLCPGLAEVSADYQEAVTRTGGSFSSICDDEWGSALAEVALLEAPVSEVRLTLDRIPIPATLSVTVHTALGQTDVIDAEGLLYEPAPVEPHVTVPQYRWVDLDWAEVTYEVLPTNWPG